MQFIKGRNIPLTLQLIKNDNSYEDEATVTYTIYENDLTTVSVSAQTAAWNTTHYCYYDLLDVSVNWLLQSADNYIVKWSISDAASGFPSVMIDDLCVLTDAASGSLTSTSISEVSDAVWDEIASDHNTELTTGYLLSEIFSRNINSVSTSGSLVKVVDFGDILTGLSTVGYTLYNANSSIYQTRTTTGVYAVSGGCYAVNVSYTNAWQGLILWDTGVTGDTNYAIDEFNSDGTTIRAVNFGDGDAGLSTVGYTLYDENGDERQARTTSGVFNVGGGCYAAVISFENAWKGIILWDTGDGNYAVDEYNVSQEVSLASNINTNVKKVLGLVHSNIYMDQPSYDGNDNLTSLRIRIYSSAASVGTSNNVISTYTVTSVGDGSGKFTSWKQVET